jgi:hypothetical protein
MSAKAANSNSLWCLFNGDLLLAGTPVFVVFGHTVFFNSIRVSFPVAFLAVQVRAILSPGQSEKLKAVRQQAIAGGYSEAPRLIIRERFKQLTGEGALPGSLPPVVLSINNARAWPLPPLIG